MAHTYTYNYSVLQVVPDERRGERVNIGLVVFHSNRADVRILASLQKVYALNANIDIEQFLELPGQIAAWLPEGADVSEAHDTLKKFGIVTVSDLGFFECEGSQYETFVLKLMNALVKPPAVESRMKIQGRVQTLLKRTFINQKVLGESLEDINRHLIVPDFPIVKNENLYADFAFKNGSYHITETINFKVRSGLSTDKFEESGLKAVKLDKARKVFGKSTKRFLVYVADAKTERQITPHLNILNDYSEHVLNLSSKKDKEFYFSTMLRNAGLNQSIS